MATTYYYNPVNKTYNSIDSTLYDMYVKQGARGFLGTTPVTEAEYKNKKISQGSLDSNGNINSIVIDPNTGAMTSSDKSKTIKEPKDNPEYLLAIKTIEGKNKKINELKGLIETSQNHIGAIKDNNPYNWQLNNNLKGDISLEEQRIKEYENAINSEQESINSYNQRIESGDLPKWVDENGAPVLDKYKYIQSQIDNYGIVDKGTPKDYFGELTPDEWMNKIYGELIPTYSEKVKKELGPDVMSAYSKSLENQYGKDYKTILENAAARGVSTSGLTGQSLADLLANKNLNIQNKENSISDELQNYLESLAQSGYNTSVKNYSQTLMDEFKKSGQSWDQFYNENQTRINNNLNEQAAQTGIDFTKYQNETNNSNQEYLDQLSAISNLFGSVGNVAGRVVGSSNTSSSNVPVTQAVMSYYPTKTTGGISNNTLSDLSNTMNTNPKTGEAYDLYSANKNWLNY